MKNIVFICESYHYGASPNGVCVKQVAEELARSGHSVRVVTFLNNINQPNYEEINSVGIFRVNPGFIEKSLYKNKNNKIKYNLTLKLSKINGILHAFKYPLLSEKQVKFMYRKTLELHKNKQIDYLVCSYHKIVDVLSGIKLKKKYPNIKLILYTLDAISGGWVPKIMRSSKIPMNSLKRWERYFFKYIDKMFAMESHRSYYKSNNEYDQYQEKIEYLDIPLLEPIDSKKNNNPHIKMVYTGSMHKASANPHYLLKMLPRIDNTQLYIYGNVSLDIKNEIKNNPLYNKRIFLCGRVSHDEIVKIQQDADVLLNFGNGNPNMIPCKIFEYMSTNKKILSFTYSLLDSSLPYIKKYPNGLIIEEDDKLINENIDKVIQFLVEETKKISKDDLSTIFEKNTPKYFEKKLMEV